jgi:1,5-anhydro-D-fructose reductase (1,5-anhydro-D-mannitol-forming)
MIRIGIVGCGRILAAHLRGYRIMREAGFDGFRITALCSRRLQDAQSYVDRETGPKQRPPCSEIAGDPLAVPPQYLSDFQDDVDVQVYDDYRVLCGANSIDAINDLTHHGLHHVIAAAGAAAGKHLMTQKPIAVTVAVAQRMCQLYRECGLTLGVFENWHYRARARYLQRLLESGLLGVPQMFSMGSIGAWWAPNRIVANTPWRHDAKQGGGIGLDMGVHQLHWVRQMAGDIEAIHANTQVAETTRFGRTPDGHEQQVECDADDTFWANCRTKSGVCGQLFASWAGRGEPTVVQPGPVLYTTKCRIAGDQVDWDDGRRGTLADLYSEHIADKQQATDFPQGIVDEFALTQLDWLNAIEKRRDPETSGESGLQDLAAAFAILESARSGEAVHVDDVLDGRLAEYQQQIEV